MTIDVKLKVGVLALLAFGFLSFYAWICIEGINLMHVCQAESGAANPPKIPLCGTEGLKMANVMDLFVPISGVVTAVAIAALSLKPGSNFFAALLPGARTDDGRWPDLFIALYLLVWVGVGLAVCGYTAFLSVEQAKAWKIEWLHTLGRTWWPTALTAVGMWLGVTANGNGNGKLLHKRDPVTGAGA